jgi:hypothetical protein
MNPDFAVTGFFVFFAVVILLSTVFFFSDLRVKQQIKIQNHHSRLKNEAARRLVETTRLHPDDRGNYPVFFDPRTLEYISPSPGNSNQIPHIYFAPGAAPGRERTIEIKPPTPSQLKINAYANRQIQGEIMPEELPQREPPEELPEPANQQFEATNSKSLANPYSELDIRAILLQAKMAKEGKNKSIIAATGAKPGDNANWRYWSATWDSFEVQK